MQKKMVKLGGVYAIKVSGRLVPVKLANEVFSGSGWHGLNLRTGREVRVRSAAKLRYPMVQGSDGRWIPDSAARAEIEAAAARRSAARQARRAADLALRDVDGPHGLSGLDSANRILRRVADVERRVADRLKSGEIDRRRLQEAHRELDLDLTEYVRFQELKSFAHAKRPGQIQRRALRC